MKIRIINENDWEKAYYYDKDIIRIGSQLGCDIQLKGQNIQPIHLQLIVTNGPENGGVIRAFADGVTLTRGEQVQNMVRTEAYDLIEGDTITLKITASSLSSGAAAPASALREASRRS